MTAQTWKTAFPLENEDVKLLPFDMQRHGPSLEGVITNQEIWAHLLKGPYTSSSEFAEDFLSQSESALVLAIIHKSSPVKQEADTGDGGPVAGLVCLTAVDARKPRASVENLILLPAFQSQGLAFKAGRLLVDSAFRPQSRTHGGGLGLIEILWEVSTRNEAGCRVAIRLGMKEGRVREYYEVVEGGAQKGKVGNGKPALKRRGATEGDVWQDVVPYSLTAQEFEKVRSMEAAEEEEAEESDVDEDDDDEELVLSDHDDDDDEDEEYGHDEDMGIKVEEDDDEKGMDFKSEEEGDLNRGVSHLDLK